MSEELNTVNEMNETEEAEKISGSEKFSKIAFDWVDSVVASVIIVVLLFALVFRVVGIVGSSMNNTLFDGERVLIFNLFYKPDQGDIVVVSRNISNNATKEQKGKEPIIKRVIATEGQEVDIRYDEKGIGHVFVDGVQFGDNYIKEEMRQVRIPNAISFPQVVPEGHIFVLGDNRNESLDSRSADIGDYGMIDTRYVMGRALVRIYPINKIGGIK